MFPCCHRTASVSTKRRNRALHKATMKKALLAGVTALFLATGTAHADELPKSIDGDYCKNILDDSQVLYEHGECDIGHPSDGAFFSSTTYENMRDVFCEFVEIKKLTATTYQIQANCVDSHAAPRKFSLFELEILPRGLLVTYFSEG
jgi:hypothetical protein